MFHQTSTNQWAEYLQVPVFKDNQYAPTSIENQWYKIKFNNRSEEKSVEINGQKIHLVLAINCDQHCHLKELSLPPRIFGICYRYDGYIFACLIH